MPVSSHVLGQAPKAKRQSSRRRSARERAVRSDPAPLVID
jgi:hypothetical protein